MQEQGCLLELLQWSSRKLSTNYHNGNFKNSKVDLEAIRLSGLAIRLPFRHLQFTLPSTLPFTFTVIIHNRVDNRIDNQMDNQVDNRPP